MKKPSVIQFECLIQKKGVSPMASYIYLTIDEQVSIYSFENRYKGIKCINAVLAGWIYLFQNFFKSITFDNGKKIAG